MKSLRLSDHFVLAEFERSATATSNGIDNTVPSQFIPALQQLCKTILEPLRAYANSPEGKPSLSSPMVSGVEPSPSQEIPIVISSGYRCNQLNIKVGGVYASQHTLGEAADIQLPKTPYTDWDDNLQHTDMEIAKKWFNFLEYHTDFDQLILETANGKDYWIHISCRKNKSKNRHQVIRELHKSSK